MYERYAVLVLIAFNTVIWTSNLVAIASYLVS